MSSDIWWMGPLVIVLLRMLSVEGRLAHEKAKKNLLVFPGSRGMRLILGGEIIGFLYLIATGYRSDPGSAAGAAGFVVLSCFAWPATITISDAGIEKRRWWRKTIKIAWSDVCGIQRNASGDLGVFSKNGEGMDFSRYQVDPFRFQEEVMRRGKLDKVIDASAPPSLLG
jgi:hypothetical protein